jgi:uncharacterized protein (TIGR01244 family)
MIAIPNAKMFEGILTGGAPSTRDLEQMAKDGVKTVIELRPDSEAGVREERETLSRLGVNYVQIPVAGAAGVTRENAERLHQALANAQAPVVVHCQSGNRVGGLFALRAHYVLGKPVDAALEDGKASGLTALLDKVKSLLGQ